MIQRSCYFQTACCFGRKNRKTPPLLESKIRAGIKTFITVRLVSYKRSFVCLRSESPPVDCKLWSSLKYFNIGQIFLAEKGLGIVLWKNDRITTPGFYCFRFKFHNNNLSAYNITIFCDFSCAYALPNRNKNQTE